MVWNNRDIAPEIFKNIYSSVDCQLHKLDYWRNLAMDLLFPAHKTLSGIQTHPQEL